MESNSVRKGGAIKLLEMRTGILLVRKCADEGIEFGSLHRDKILK